MCDFVKLCQSIVRKNIFKNFLFIGQSVKCTAVGWGAPRPTKYEFSIMPL